ncbi:UNVERIFIED_CONTAM: hypothetical protein Sangu_2205700 [Sesamum angustifolium]|uniref:HMA domain-containing protein n=1 Tax=Sesamum angustifolium TaxID=2727405 RepID=A0AAW2LFL9_9LAMI
MGGDELQIVPAGKNVEAQFVEMMVPLYSCGCENKVKKALANLKGIYSVNVDFHQQKVTVWGICDKHDVLCVVKKKRKGARLELGGQRSVTTTSRLPAFYAIIAATFLITC